MTSIQIKEQIVSNINGKTAVVTGGADGIGWATAELLHDKGANVYILDLKDLDEVEQLGTRIKSIQCDVASWSSIRAAFKQIENIDMIFANAGIREMSPFLQVDELGEPTEPEYGILDVNLRGVLNTIKVGWAAMKKQGHGGSIVLTSSNLAYSPSPWQPLYSATKTALVGIVRSLRTIAPQDGIAINAVAPSPTSTSILPSTFHAKLTAAGVPVSSPQVVALALLYSATAYADRRVESYGNDNEEAIKKRERWNGRVIYICGEQYTEVEEPLADLSSSWLGEENLKVTRSQQALIDKRQQLV